MGRCSGLAAVLAGVVIFAAPVDAGVRQRIAAANAVERRLEDRHPRYRWVAACEQRTARRFACRFHGRRGARSGIGRATAVRTGRRRYRVTINSLRFR